MAGSIAGLIASLLRHLQLQQARRPLAARAWTLNLKGTQRPRQRTQPRRHRHGHPGRDGETALLRQRVHPRRGQKRSPRPRSAFSLSDSSFVNGIEPFVHGGDAQSRKVGGPGLPFTCFLGPAPYSQTMAVERRRRTARPSRRPLNAFRSGGMPQCVPHPLLVITPVHAGPPPLPAPSRPRPGLSRK